MTYTREELIEAMKKYNEEFAAKPHKFSKTYDSPDAARLQVDKLLSFIPKQKDNESSNTGRT